MREEARRSIILKIQPKRRRLHTIITNLLTNIDHHTINLSTLEFMMMSNLYQMNANYVFQFLELALIHNTVSICIVYTILLSTLGVPFNMILTFMSSYSRKSFLGFWQCVPLFEGVGYSAGLIRLSIEIFNVLQAAVALLLLVHVQDSNFPNYVHSCEASIGNKYQNICVTPQPNQIQNCNTVQPYTAFQVYYKIKIAKYDYYEDILLPPINYSLLWAVISIWILIFILASLGMKRIHRFLLYPEMFMLFSILCLSVLILFLAKRGQVKDNRHYDNPIIKFDFWVILIIHASEINYFGNTIWMSTMMPNHLHPKFAALIHPPIKMVIFMSLLGMVTLVFKDNTLYYNLDGLECINAAADDILFVLIPDILLRHKWWPITLSLWYTGLFYYMILPPVYSILGFLISIEERFPKVGKYHILFCAIICILGIIFTFPLTTEMGAYALIIWKYCGFTIMVSSLLLIVNLAIFFVYTTDQVINDYTFTYGQPPEKYWTTLWKCCPLFSLLAFLLALTFQSTNTAVSNSYSIIMMASYVHAALMLSPIIVMAVIKFCTHVQNRKLGDLIQPSPEWGPREENLNLARKNYYPRRNARFRVNKLKCQHKCSVVNNKMCSKEKDIQRKKIESIFDT